MPCGRVLTGDGRGLDATDSSCGPGICSCSKGRFSLHRVSSGGGSAQRHTAIFAYNERPGVIGTAERTGSCSGGSFRTT